MELVHEEIDTKDLDVMIDYLRGEIGEHGHEPAYQLLNTQLNKVVKMKTERMLSRKTKIILTKEEYGLYINNNG